MPNHLGLFNNGETNHNPVEYSRMIEKKEFDMVLSVKLVFLLTKKLARWMADEKVNDNEYLLANMAFHKISNNIILPQLETDEIYQSASLQC